MKKMDEDKIQVIVTPRRIRIKDSDGPDRNISLVRAKERYEGRKRYKQRYPAHGPGIR